jgi:hypothetical protein
MCFGSRSEAGAGEFPEEYRHCKRYSYIGTALPCVDNYKCFKHSFGKTYRYRATRPQVIHRSKLRWPASGLPQQSYQHQPRPNAYRSAFPKATRMSRKSCNRT